MKLIVLHDLLNMKRKSLFVVYNYHYIMVDPGTGAETELRIVIAGAEGTISDRDWTDKDATVVCREMNSTYTVGKAVYARYSFEKSYIQTK